MEPTPADWLEIFAPETPVVELIARGSALYLGMLILVRLMPRRSGGELGMMDIAFVLLIADAAARSLGGYSSVADGFIVIVTLMGWNFIVNALSFHVPLIERLVSAPAIQVVRDGQLLWRNMRREFLTEEELMSHLREQGIDDLRDVKSACVESDGKISAITKRT